MNINNNNNNDNDNDNNNNNNNDNNNNNSNNSNKNNNNINNNNSNNTSNDDNNNSDPNNTTTNNNNKALTTVAIPITTIAMVILIKSNETWCHLTPHLTAEQMLFILPVGNSSTLMHTEKTIPSWINDHVTPLKISHDTPTQLGFQLVQAWHNVRQSWGQVNADLQLSLAQTGEPWVCFKFQALVCGYAKQWSTNMTKTCNVTCW